MVFARKILFFYLGYYVGFRFSFSQFELSHSMYQTMENDSKLNPLIPYEVINHEVLCGFSAIESKILPSI